MRLMIHSAPLKYIEKSRLFGVLAWNGPYAAWHEYRKMMAGQDKTAWMFQNNNQEEANESNRYQR